MFDLKNKLVPTPPREIPYEWSERNSERTKSGKRKQKDDCSSVKKFQDNKTYYCHSELISESKNLFTPHPNPLPQGAREQNAFTLAEVLITLVIIGVIAAITVPTLIVKYQKEQTVTRLKKAYSTLAQTTQRAIADNGPINTWELGASGNGNDAHSFFIKYLKPYLNVSKDCETTQTGTCKFQTSYFDSTSYGQLNNAYSRFYLNDGTLVAIYISNDSEKKFIPIYVDINGSKKPNKFGRDIFYFIYYIDYSNHIKGHLVPAESQKTREQLTGSGYGSCSKTASDVGGRYCAALIMKDGWQIKDDYPW